MFSRLFTVLGKLPTLKNPKLYLVSKVWICLCIILQRAIIFIQNPEQQENPLKPILQILVLLLFLTIEYLLLWFFSKRKPPERIQIFCTIVVHLFFSQLFTELSLLSLETTERKDNEVIFQDIFFLNGVLVFFTDSQIVKDALILYLSAVSLLRLTTLDNELLYISWALMFVMLACLPMIGRISKQEKIKIPVKPNNGHNKYLKLETALEGVALISKDQEILYMNGLFKGLMDVSTEREALERILKLKRVDLSASQKTLQEIKLKTVVHAGSTGSRKDQKSFGNIPKSTIEQPTSLEIPKSGSNAPSRNISPRPSIFQNRTSILRHRNSVFVPTPSIAVRKESRAQSTKNPDVPSSGSTSGHPLIKINLTKGREVDSRPVWFGSDSECRSPLINGFGGDSFRSVFGAKSSNGQISMQEHAQPEQITLRVDTTERNSPRSDNVEASIDNAFLNMHRTSDKNQNVVITQLIENLVSPLEVIKGSSNSPTNGRGQESTTLGNPSRDKFNVIFRDAKKGTKILEVVLCPFIYQQRECLCICVRDVSYELKSEDLNETLEYRNQLLRFVSHEFRGPLNCSILFLDALKELVPEELNSKYVVPSLNSSKMLLNLANDILDHAQIQAKKLKINITACKIKKVIEEVIEMIEIQASGQDIQLSLKWDSRIAQRFYTDPNRLKQILLNLVSNGLKYTNHGSITIQTTYVAPTICRISVTDTGVGISKANLKLLFQEFGKIQANSHLNPHGVGLGLVISKMLTLELGPDNEGLMVESVEGKGTEFYFFLESKIKAGDDSDDFESLEENGNSLLTVIRTTYGGHWDNVSSRRTSILKTPQLLEPSPRQETRAIKVRTLSPVPLSRPEIPAPKTLLGIPQSKTVDNLESITAKKKSSDNILSPQKKSPAPFLRTLHGKETKAPFLRSYTMEGGGESTRRSHTIRSDSEFSLFMKKIRHNCSSPKALLVDDSRFNLTALETLLSNTFGIESKQVMNGEEAIIEVLKNEQCCAKCKNFKVIFMDIEMPRLNGFETTEILRKKMLEGEISFIPIIGITGHNPNDNRVQCLTSGMNDLVSKPISPKIIKQLIIKWIIP